MASSSYLSAENVPLLIALPDKEIALYRSLVSRAVDVFGDELKASRWLSLPNQDLDGQTPLQAVQKNGYDSRILDSAFTRIEHGIDY